MLIQGGADLNARNNNGYTPLALAVNYKKPDVAELLLDKGANMSKVREDVEVPDWVSAIIAKRQSMKRGLLAFIGVLRKRFTVSGGGTEYTRGRLPRDVVGVISRWAWSTRFDKRWEGAVLETVIVIARGVRTNVASDDSECGGVVETIINWATY